MGSAVCTFSLESIQEVFNGKFKEQATSSSAWLPVLSSKVPEPRPGLCVNDTQTLPDSVLNFIRGHPLMDSAVAHDNGKPVFYKRDIQFSKLVVDRLEVDGLPFAVFYVATSKIFESERLIKVNNLFQVGNNHVVFHDCSLNRCF